MVNISYIGVGSLLVSCAHYGAKVMGSDLDYNLICGYGELGRKRYGNFLVHIQRY